VDESGSLVTSLRSPPTSLATVCNRRGGPDLECGADLVNGHAGKIADVSDSGKGRLASRS